MHVKFFIIVVCMLFTSSMAKAVDLTCSIPNANVVKAVELCETLRVSLRVRSSEWSNSICASQFLRIGLMQGERVATKRSFQRNVNAVVREAVENFQSTWPDLTPSVCGDGVLDEEFGEECDDGNIVGGDGCSSSCEIE